MKASAIMPYDPDWPLMFEKESCQLQKVLGENCLDVYHIGSTSVPGLWSKPVIDIIGVVKDRLESVQLLESSGYIYKGEINIPFRCYLTKEGYLKIHLHVYTAESPEIELNLLFRNYLQTHPEAQQEYIFLKKKLVKQGLFVKKENERFTEYTLGKYHFIQKILRQTGFDKLRMLRCTHNSEWETARALRQKYFFDKVPTIDPYIWTFHHPDHTHFVLYKGAHIVGYAHLQQWPEARAALRIIAIEEAYRRQRYGEQFLDLCERWLKEQGYKNLYMESSLQSLPFYQKQGYTDTLSDDPDDYESNPQDIPLSKIL